MARVTWQPNVTVIPSAWANDVNVSTYENPGYAADSGAVNAYVLTPKIIATSYYAGMQITFITPNANTLASTVNVSGLGAMPIVNNGGGALLPGQIRANSPVHLTYDGTSFEIHSISLAMSDARYAPLAYSQSVSISANTVLTAAQSGTKFITTAALTVTLPVPALGLRYRIYGTSTGVVTIQHNATESIYFPDGSSAASFAMPLNTLEFIDLVCDGVSWRSWTTGRAIIANAVNANEAVAWGQAQGSFAALAGLSTQAFNVANATAVSQAVALGQFTAGQIGGTNCSQPLPGGYILKFGTTASIAANSTLAVVFSAAFPSGLLMPPLLTPNTLSNTAQAQDAITASSATGFTATNQDNIAHTLNWFAIGY